MQCVRRRTYLSTVVAAPRRPGESSVPPESRPHTGGTGGSRSRAGTPSRGYRATHAREAAFETCAPLGTGARVSFFLRSDRMRDRVKRSALTNAAGVAAMSHKRVGAEGVSSPAWRRSCLLRCSPSSPRVPSLAQRVGFQCWSQLCSFVYGLMHQQNPVASRALLQLLLTVQAYYTTLRLRLRAARGRLLSAHR